MFGWACSCSIKTEIFDSYWGWFRYSIEGSSASFECISLALCSVIQLQNIPSPLQFEFALIPLIAALWCTIKKRCIITVLGEKRSSSRSLNKKVVTDAHDLTVGSFIDEVHHCCATWNGDCTEIIWHLRVALVHAFHQCLRSSYHVSSNVVLLLNVVNEEFSRNPVPKYYRWWLPSPIKKYLPSNWKFAIFCFADMFPIAATITILM
jgi:hypothetical protein